MRGHAVRCARRKIDRVSLLETVEHAITLTVRIVPDLDLDTASEDVKGLVLALVVVQRSGGVRVKMQELAAIHAVVNDQLLVAPALVDDHLVQLLLSEIMH